MEPIDEELAALGAALVDDRTLRRIIKRHRRLPGLGLQVPHAQVYTLPKSDLRPEDGLDERAAKLPEHVIVFSGPREEIAAGDPEETCAAWRAIFHGRVHLELADQVARGTLTLAAIRERIHRIGQIEFDEVRFVLRQEDRLLAPTSDDIATYTEFVACYLELRHFDPTALAQTFPTLHGASWVAPTIELDVDPAMLLAAARPPRAPTRPLIALPPTGERPVPILRAAPTASLTRALARRSADVARRRGNLARAAILATRLGDTASARTDLAELATRLSRALGDCSSEGWAETLLPVAQYAGGRLTAGARLLADLQAACVVSEREVRTVDIAGWVLSRGKRKIVRPLPSAREVRIARHLRAAAGKLARCDLGSGGERARLASIVQAMVARANENVRAKLRPIIEGVLHDVGLEPRQLPERVAQKKLVDELLDHAVAMGRLSIGNLRDVIAHNDLKLPDLRVHELLTGDQLLRADAQLATQLDGVYRRGEIYLRWLQKISSVLSGTALGRLLTLYVLLPVVGSFFVVEGAQHMVGPIVKATGRPEPEIATTAAFVSVGVFVFLILHLPIFRNTLLEIVRGIGRGLRVVFWDFPRLLWRIPGFPRFTRWVLIPALPALLPALLLTGPLRWVVAGMVFVPIALVVNSSVAAEWVSDWLYRSGRQLAQRIVPGIVKYSLELFSWLIELLERGIYRVDEALRFRPGESRAAIVAKGAIGAIWFLVAYVLRIYVNLLIEPTVNPVKHFPVVTVAAKVILPFTPLMLDAIGGPTGDIVGPALGASIAAFTILVLPGLAGFLAWELNGNWKLYRRTRAEMVGAVSIGSHGETMGGFMKPGFHSGTIPKLHARLRRASARGDERGVTRHRVGLHHVEEAIEKFADRQMVSMLNEAPSFRATDVAVHHVEVGSNRVRIQLACPSVAPEPATICFEQQSGWLVAGVPTPGWIDALDEIQRHIVEIALAGFYKLSGVDLVREQIEHFLRDGAPELPPYDIADPGLVSWPGPGFANEIVQPLSTLARRSSFFGRTPMRWITWSTTWEHLGFGMEPKLLVPGPSLLPAATGAAAQSPP